MGQFLFSPVEGGPLSEASAYWIDAGGKGDWVLQCSGIALEKFE
jgi:hypothetical protein